MGARGRKVRYPGEGTMGVIGIISSSRFLRLCSCDVGSWEVGIGE